jgi:hypothetical protein
MKSESLFYFNSPKEFKAFILKLGFIDDWTIKRGLMNRRGFEISDKPYTIFLKNKFKEKGFFRRNVSVAEIVTWLDNFLLVDRFLNELEMQVGTKYYNQLEIFVEYRIRLSKNMRIDYIFKHKEKVCSVEFRTIETFEKIRPTWSKKKSELLIYKEMMLNYSIFEKYLTYAFIALYEYSKTTPIYKHIEYNNNQIKYLSMYLREFMFNFSNS